MEQIELLSKVSWKLEEVRTLLYASYPTNHEGIDLLLNNDGYIKVLLLINDKVISFGSYLKSTKVEGIYGIYWIATLELYRKKGYGSFIMKYILDYISTRDIGKGIAKINCKPELKEMYESLGFHLDSTRNDGDLIMSILIRQIWHNKKPLIPLVNKLLINEENKDKIIL